MAGAKFASTSEIPIPENPLERIIGQEEAVRIARLVPSQRRHLLLVGPPGTGKSLIARAIASLLPPTKQEISVLDNPERPERPIIEVRDAAHAGKEAGQPSPGKEVQPENVPVPVAERLGIRCARCGMLTNGQAGSCVFCGALLPGVQRDARFAFPGKAEGDAGALYYSFDRLGRVVALTEKEVRAEEEQKRKSRRKVLLAIGRNPFVQASGASETELLGDVAHDPYGGHKELGTPPFMRVMPGAVHEAHEGVLFIDELPNLGSLQKHLLTAMQERSFPIAGRNATSSGAAVRVDSVPCDFILVGAANMSDLSGLMPALRSRISGDGYEVLMNAAMPDNPINREKLTQFVAQEIRRDGRIPHADFGAVGCLINHAKKIAKDVDGEANALTLRLRALSGVIKLAGDLAAVGKNELISKREVGEAIERARSIEERIQEKYGSGWKASVSDYAHVRSKPGSETR